MLAANYYISSEKEIGLSKAKRKRWTHCPGFKLKGKECPFKWPIICALVFKLIRKIHFQSMRGQKPAFQWDNNWDEQTRQLTGWLCYNRKNLPYIL